MTDAKRDADIAVVGGGMVGAALACALADANFKVTLLEARPPAEQWSHDSYDMRVSAITRASQRILQNLSVWDDIVAERATAYRRMRVWDQAEVGEIAFDARDAGEPDLGHIVENRVIQRALWRRFASAGVELRAPGEISDMRETSDGMSVDLKGGERLNVSLLVAADGARSLTRTLAGIDVQGWAYDQHAIVATVRPAQGHGETAWQRFMPTGPLALLPIGPECFSIVWSTSPQQAQQLLALSPQAFGEALTRTSEGRVGDIELLSERAVFPLRLQHATSYIKPGLALVGDAAHVIHPLAGQGVNLGLMDIATLADVLQAARSQRRPIGSVATLRRYERARKGENLRMQFAMDGFKRLFSNDLPPLKFARNLGLAMTDRITPLKRLFMSSAAGQTSDTPSLARSIYTD